MEYNTHPRWNESVQLAASHFLSCIPPNMTGENILEALFSEEDLPEGLIVWQPLEDQPYHVGECIENLAKDFIDFLENRATLPE